MLKKKLQDALANARIAAQDTYLVHLSNAVAAIDARQAADPELQAYASALDALLDDSSFGVNPHLTNKFAQILGEAHFWLMCLDKGLRLTRIAEVKNKKTPDFSAPVGSQSIYFEVKTLSVVGGDAGIADALHSSLDAHIDLEAQQRAGARVAIAMSEAQPYGDKVKHDQTLLSVINTLVEKARGNIKADQFAMPNTFLVINLSIIPPFITEPKALRPAYPDDYMFPKAVTGDLWTLAFGRTGMPILGIPEFEGKPCVEGLFDKVGILADQEFSAVAGLIFMIHPWQRPSELWGLFRGADRTQWEDANPDLLQQLQALTGKLWNDCGDTNGWQLQ